MKTIPENYTEHPEDVMSNCFHEINTKVANKLKNEELFAQYSGWNFCGSVWWNRAFNNWNCEIRQYHSHVATVEATTLKELMEIVSDRYGQD